MYIIKRKYYFSAWYRKLCIIKLYNTVIPHILEQCMANEKYKNVYQIIYTS